MTHYNVKEKSRFAKVGVCVLYLYSMLYTFALPVMYPSMLSQYGLMPYYALFGAISIAMSCISTPVGGKLCDMIGRKRLFRITGTARLILMFLCGIKTTPLLFSILYLTSSFITGFMYAIPLAIVSDITTAEERPKYYGYFGAITGVSLLAGILFSGVITDLFGACSMFFIFIPILLAALILIEYGYQEPARPKGNLDWAGVALMAICLGAIVALCNFAGTLFAWLSWISGVLIILIAASFIVFLRHEKHISDPLLDLAIFTDKNFCLSFLCGFLIAPMVNLCSGYLVFYGQVALGVSSTVSSTLALPKNILYFVLPTFLGIWVSKKLKRYKLAFLGCGALIALAGALSSTWGTSTKLIFIYLVMIVYGLATCCQSISLQPYMQLTIPAERVGIAASLISFSTTLGSTLISAVNTVYFNSRYSISSNVPKALEMALSKSQLNDLIAPDTLKSADRLAALRSTIPGAQLELFDQAVLNLRSAGADVFRLISIITFFSGMVIILLTVILFKKDRKTF